GPDWAVPALGAATSISGVFDVACAGMRHADARADSGPDWAVPALGAVTSSSGVSDVDFSRWNRTVSAIDATAGATEPRRSDSTASGTTVNAGARAIRRGTADFDVPSGAAAGATEPRRSGSAASRPTVSAGPRAIRRRAGSFDARFWVWG